MYICFVATKYGFRVGCRRLIWLNSCFLKGLMKCQLIVIVGKDGNNKIFLTAWSMVEKQTMIERWTWFIQHIRSDLYIGDGLG